MQSIFCITRKELEEYFINIGEKKFKATQVSEWIYRKGARSFDEMSNISKEVYQQKLGEIDNKIEKLDNEIESYTLLKEVDDKIENGILKMMQFI